LDGSSNPKQITGQYQFINTSATPIPLSELQIYYFYTNEETSGWNLHVYSSQLDGGTGGYRDLTSATTFTIGPLSPALNDADSYTQIAFTGTQSIENGATAKVSWDMQPNDYNPPDQVQANDYSFNAADTGFTAWDHIAVYQGDTLVYGCVPKSQDDGSAGAGGDTGAGGAVGAAGAD
jgi:hypothetical protein